MPIASLPAEQIFDALTFTDFSTARNCSIVSKRFSGPSLAYLGPLKKKIVDEYLGREREFLDEWSAPLKHWHGRMITIVGDIRRETDLMHYWQYRYFSNKDDVDEAEAAWHGFSDNLPYNKEELAEQLGELSKKSKSDAVGMLVELGKKQRELESKHALSGTDKRELSAIRSSNGQLLSELHSLHNQLDAFYSESTDWEMDDTDMIPGWQDLFGYWQEWVEESCDLLQQSWIPKMKPN